MDLTVDHIDNRMTMWMSLHTYGLLHIGGLSSSTVMDDIFNGKSLRQIVFREDGPHRVEVQFWEGEPITAQLNCEPIDLPAPKMDNEVSIRRFSFMVDVNIGDTITFSREPITRTTFPS